MSWTDRIPAVTRRRLRVVAWRTRRPVAALCAGLAVLLAVELLRAPDPPTVEVAVAARDLAADRTLTGGDVTRRVVPAALVPAGLVPAEHATAGEGADPVEDLLGRRLAVDVPAGLPVVPELLVDDDTAAPPGTVVVPVRFADTGVAAVLRAGMRVDVVASGLHDGAGPERVARDALVLGAPGIGSPDEDGDDGGDAGSGGGSGGGLLGGGGTGGGAAGAGDDDVPVLLAVTPEESIALGGASGSRALGAVIVG